MLPLGVVGVPVQAQPVEEEASKEAVAVEGEQRRKPEGLRQLQGLFFGARNSPAIQTAVLCPKMQACCRGRLKNRYLNVSALAALLNDLTRAPAVLVSVHQTRGSVPRGTDAWMAVFALHTVGTVGGGRLEWDAIAHARTLLHPLSAAGREVRRYPLGPALGQCCGGEVHLSYVVVTASDVPALTVQLRGRRLPVALFGGGHVGRALITVFAPLPFEVTWIDSRDEVFPEDAPDNVRCEHSSPVHTAVPGLAAHSQVLIMSFSHAEDLEVVAACLRRMREQDDLAFIGLIGSATKWASFQSRLRERGFSQTELDRITCPIGLPGIRSKAPEIIAASVAAQLLQRLPA